MFLGPAAYGRMQPDLDRTYMAAAVECCVCTAAGAAPLRRRCCGLRRSARDRRDAEGCSSSSVAARDASTRRAPDYASQHERCFRHCCVESGSAPYPQRVGTPPKARLWKPYAPARSSRADACERQCLCRPHIDAYDEAGQGFFEMTLRFGLNAPRERPHMFLTALARVAQWAGFYVRRFVAFARYGVLHHHDHHGRHAGRSRGARR